MKSDFPVYTIKDEQKKKGADAMKHKFTSLFITVLVASDIGCGGQYYIFVGCNIHGKEWASNSGGP